MVWGLTLTLAVFTQHSAWSQSTEAAQSKAPAFTEQEALRVLERIGDALESHGEQAFLREFDSERMTDYPVFRDQIHALFQQYESFQVSYEARQTTMEGSNGVFLAHFTLDAHPTDADLPEVRKDVQLRLVLSFTKQRWKIVALSPRELFAS